MRRFLLLCTLSLGVAAFACDTTPTATIQLDLGGETGVFTRDPAPTKISVDVIDSAGTKTNLYAGGINDTISLKDEDVNNVGYLDVVATDDTGAIPIVRGRSLPVTFGALSDAVFDVFVQRTGELARMPAAIDGRQAPLVSIVTGRYVLMAGGDTTSGLYDVLTWSGLDSPPTLPRTPKSIAVSGTNVLLVDDMGASSFDLSATTSSDITVPGGGTLAEISGGYAVYANDGTAYVVGGTRTSGDPSARVLVIGTDGTLSFASLATPRLGAAATWLEGRGVVVIGGSTTGQGVEILSPGSTSAAPLNFPAIADPVLSAAVIDSTHVVAGANPALFDVSCAMSCTPVAWAKLPVALVHADYFPLPSITTDFVAVGWDAAGDSHFLRGSQMAATEIALKVPRKQARGIALPNGAIAVVGGVTQAESYFP